VEVNLDDLLEATGRDADLAQELLLVLRRQIPEALSEIHRAHAAGEAVMIRRTAHTLRGPLATVGAKAAQALAEELEQMVGESTLGEAGPLIDKLDVALQVVSREVTLVIERAVK